MKIHLIAGLPGSAKSFLAKKLAGKHGGLIIDDPKSLKSIEAILASYSFDNYDFPCLIIADPWLCEADSRKRMRKFFKSLFAPIKVSFKHYYFENDLEACRLNVARRADGRNVRGSLRRFAKTYSIPSNVKQIPVWKPE